MLSQNQVISLSIGRTTFNTKRLVEYVQKSLISTTQCQITVRRGKLGKIDISGKAPNVFEVGVFILEEIILKQRPVLWPLVTLSFWQNQKSEYMFFPCGNDGHSKFQPKPANQTDQSNSLQKHELGPVIFCKRINVKDYTKLTAFLQEIQTTNVVWQLNVLKYAHRDNNSRRHSVRVDNAAKLILFAGNMLEVQDTHYKFTTLFSALLVLT
jgi:hypothetical protein